MSVPLTILAQLGGVRFIAMTGARLLVRNATSLTMQLPSRITKARVTHCRVTLTPADEYRVATLKTSRKTGDLEIVESLDGVQCGDLERVFTALTGLETRL